MAKSIHWRTNWFPSDNADIKSILNSYLVSSSTYFQVSRHNPYGPVQAPIADSITREFLQRTLTQANILIINIKNLICRNLKIFIPEFQSHLYYLFDHGLYLTLSQPIIHIYEVQPLRVYQSNQKQASSSSPEKGIASPRLISMHSFISSSFEIGSGFGGLSIKIKYDTSVMIPAHQQ